MPTATAHEICSSRALWMQHPTLPALLNWGATTYEERARVFAHSLPDDIDDLRTLQSETALSIAEFRRASRDRLDAWVPAAGGMEVPFACRGRRLLYVFNCATMRHAYLDLDRDIVLTDEEAQEVLNS